jgi:subtilase family serine protease
MFKKSLVTLALLMGVFATQSFAQDLVAQDWSAAGARLQIKLVNTGTLPSGACKVAVAFHCNSGSVPVVKVDAPALAPGESQVLSIAMPDGSCFLNRLRGGLSIFVVTIDCDNQVAESDGGETNNTRTLFWTP